MANSRYSKSLHLLACLISSSALGSTANGIVIPSSQHSWKNDDSSSAKSAASPPAHNSNDLHTSRQSHKVSKDESNVSPRIPAWARVSDRLSRASESLERNLHDGSGRFLPTRILKPSARRRPRPYFDSPKKLPTPKVEWDQGIDLPASSRPKRRPVLKLVDPIARQPDPLAVLESKLLEDVLKSVNAPSSEISEVITSSASLDHKSIVLNDGQLFHVTDARFVPIKADSFSPPAESLPPCDTVLGFLTNPHWFERTSVLVLAMLVLFFLAVGVVEVGDSIWRRLMKGRRRRWAGRRGAVWLDGDEKRLSAIQEVDEED